MEEKEEGRVAGGSCQGQNGSALVPWLVLLGLTPEEIATISGLQISDVQRLLVPEKTEGEFPRAELDEGIAKILFPSQLWAYAEFMCGPADSHCRQLLGGRALFFQKVMSDRLDERAWIELLAGMEMGFRLALWPEWEPVPLNEKDGQRVFTDALCESAASWWMKVLEDIHLGWVQPPDDHQGMVRLLARYLSEQRTRFLNQPFTDWTDPKPNVFLRSVDDLELPRRAANCLENADIKLVGELVEKTEPQLLWLKNFGRKSLMQVRHALERIGLRIEMRIDPDTRWWVIQKRHGLGTEPLTLEQKLLLPVEGLLPWQDAVYYLHRDADLRLLGEVVQKTDTFFVCFSPTWRNHRVAENIRLGVERLGLALGMELSPELQEAIRTERQRLDAERKEA